MAAMRQFTSPARRLKEGIGELTTVYDQIAPELINRIRNRFNSNYFGEHPFPPIGDKTRVVRKARGDDPKGPALVSSGRLRDSIKRRPGPTKSGDGGQREVYVLRIGSTGVPYAKEVLRRRDWELPVFFHEEKGWFLIDHDNLPGAISSNQREYTPGTLKFIETDMEHTALSIPVPGRDFLAMPPEDQNFAMSRINDFFANMNFNDDSVLATLYPIE